ncbi:MAG: outer membrane beta-barrel protein [Bryobacterales bacterium]|nr:outer membrane beta-barrel protein [Bryobacterales bacterium]
MNKLLLKTATLLCLLANLALAQKYEVSPLVSYPRWGREGLGSLNDTNNKDTDTQIRGRLGYGIRLTLNTPGYYGHEIGYILNDATFRTDIVTTEGRTTRTTRYEDKVKVQQAFYNFLLYMMPAGERIRPFIAVGAQLYQYGAPRILNFDVGQTRNYGANYGAGVKFKLIEHLNVRMDFRHYIGGKPYDLKFANERAAGGGLINQFEGSMGFSITF